MYKFIFLAASVSWLVVSRIFFTDSTSIEYLILVIVIYSIGLHWVYAYIFNSDMHYNVGKIKSEENKKLRLILFYFGVVTCISVTCYA